MLTAMIKAKVHQVNLGVTKDVYGWKVRAVMDPNNRIRELAMLPPNVRI